MTPTGLIKAFNDGTHWEDLTRYDEYLRAAADPVGWPLDRLRAHMGIESRGNPEAVQRNPSNGDSYGLFQVVPYGIGWAGWHDLIAQKGGLGRNPTSKQILAAILDADVNCAVGVAILESYYQQYGTLDQASSAFFTGRPDWGGGGDTVNGTTGRQYRTLLNTLIAEQQAFAPPDLIAYIVSGVKYTSDFGFGAYNVDANGNPLNFYQYGVGHGDGLTRPNQHTGRDIMVPLYTPLRTPLPGVVRCVGNTGTGDWGQGCGAFKDTTGGGIGNLTVLTDVGLKITFGHVNSTPFRVGARVAAGDVVARSGGDRSPHCHLDVSEYAPENVNRRIAGPGDYWLLDPIPALAKALGQAIPPPPPTYADPLPLPQAREFDVSVTVMATRDGVPVLSRASLDSARANAPLAKGETFEAVYQVLGNDHHIYWVSTRGSRIPVEGTSAPDWKGFASDNDVTCPPPPDLSPALDELQTIYAEVSHVIGTLRNTQ